MAPEVQSSLDLEHLSKSVIKEADFLDEFVSIMKLLPFTETGKKAIAGEDLLLKIETALEGELEDAETIYDIWNDKSLNFEKLKGTENSYSMRLNVRYRLEMDIDWINQECTIGIVEVTDISNHYK